LNDLAIADAGAQILYLDARYAGNALGCFGDGIINGSFEAICGDADDLYDFHCPRLDELTQCPLLVRLDPMLLRSLVAGGGRLRR
jgi:hypothetical protein